MVMVPRVRMINFTPGRMSAMNANVIDNIISSGEDKVLDMMYKALPVGSTRKLENFNGQRKISVYRGKGYLNKITQKLEPNIRLVRNMTNIGTKSNPRMVTRTLALQVPNTGEGMEIYFSQPGRSDKGVRVVLYRSGYDVTAQDFPNLMAIRKNERILNLLERWTGKKLK